MRELRFESPESILFDGADRVALPAHGLRVVISDFMPPRSPVNAVRRLGNRGSLIVIRVLGPWEAQPPAGELWP